MIEKKITQLVFLGASTAFFEVSEIIRNINIVKKKFKIVAILDDNKTLHDKKLNNIEIIGNLDLVKDFYGKKFVFGIGSMKTRLIRHKIFERLNLPDNRFQTIIHPSANIDPSAKIGNGSIIHPGVFVGNNVCLDPFSIVAVNSAIGPYSHVGRFAMITSLVTILSGVTIGKSAFIGASSCLAENIKVGSGAFIGIGSIIGRDVKPGAFVLGNPGRVISLEKVPSELLEKN